MKILQRAEDGIPRLQANEVIRRLIRNRGYQKGDRLPTYSEFAKQLGFAILTIQRAMDDLAEEGVVYRLHGKGTFVGSVSATSAVNLTRAALVFPSSPLFLVETPHLNQILAGLLGACGRHNIDLNITSLFAAGGKVAPGKIAEQSEGAILLGIGDEAYLAEFAEEGLPVVGVDFCAPNIPLPYIVVDNPMGVRQVMEHLMLLQHRRIAYVEISNVSLLGSNVASHDAVERKNAYLEFMQGAGLSSYAKVYEVATEGSTGEQIIADDLQKSDGPTALLAYDETIALKVMQVLASRGIRVPDAVSIAAAAAAPVVGAAAPAGVVTSAVFNFKTMGSMAMEQLRERCKSSRPKKSVMTRVPSQLVVGYSSARTSESKG